MRSGLWLPGTMKRRAVAAFLPSDLSSLRLWLRGDQLPGAGGSTISTWDDDSGQNNDGTGSDPTGTTNLPTVVASGLNGLKVARFPTVAGTANPRFDLPNFLTGMTEGSVWYVAKCDADPPGNADLTGPLIGDFGNSAENYPWTDSNIYVGFMTDTFKGLNPTADITAWHIGGYRSKSADYRINLNGTQELSTGTNTVAVGSAPKIGGKQTTRSFDGDLAEVVFCNSFLTDGDAQKIEGYLAHKWGLTSVLPGGHPYKSVAP